MYNLNTYYYISKNIIVQKNICQRIIFSNGWEKIDAFSGHGAGVYKIHAPELRTRHLHASQARERKRVNEAFSTPIFNFAPNPLANERAGRGRYQMHHVAKICSRTSRV